MVSGEKRDKVKEAGSSWRRGVGQGIDCCVMGRPFLPGPWAHPSPVGLQLRQGAGQCLAAQGAATAQAGGTRIRKGPFLGLRCEGTDG